MALSLLVPLFPGLGEEIAVSFGTAALVIGIALIATGFTQGVREQIAYYQEAIIVQMAGMATGPAALAWLNDEPDVVFFALTIAFGIIMGGYLFYTVAEQSGRGPVVSCFLDEVPAMYGKTALKIANGIIVGISLTLIAASIIARRYINAIRKRTDDHVKHRRLLKLYKWTFTIIIFCAETALAVCIQFTLQEYNSLVPADIVEAADAWQFGQIIPLMMLLAPFMDVIRAVRSQWVETHSKEKRNEGEAPVGDDAVNEAQSEKLEYKPETASGVEVTEVPKELP